MYPVNRWSDWRPPSLCWIDAGITEIATGLLGSAAIVPASEATTAALLAAPSVAAPGFAATSLGATALTGASADALVGEALPSLATVGGITSGLGTVLSAKSAIDQANYAQNAAQVENQAQVQKGNDDAAAGERQQIQQDRQTQLALSRAQAVAAASGGGASDTGVVNVEGNIAQQGQYNALTALSNGQARSAADQYQGQVDLFQGERAAQAGPLNATGAILNGISGFANNRAMLRYFTKIGSAPLGSA